jgi:hypothetical protein
MSLIKPPQVTITTPFMIDESILTGFDYTITPIEYIRTAVGARITTDIPPMHDRFCAYNDELAKVASDMNIKLLSLNEITIAVNDTREFLSFLVTINRYIIMPKETLTAEQEWHFNFGINKLLSTVRTHDMRDFFITDSLTTLKRGNDRIILRKNRISLPTMYIHVDEELKTDDNLKIIQYIDKCNAFYRKPFNAAYNEEEEYSENFAVPADWDSD